MWDNKLIRSTTVLDRFKQINTYLTTEKKNLPDLFSTCTETIDKLAKDS